MNTKSKMISSIPIDELLDKQLNVQPFKDRHWDATMAYLLGTRRNQDSQERISCRCSTHYLREIPNLKWGKSCVDIVRTSEPLNKDTAVKLEKDLSTFKLILKPYYYFRDKFSVFVFRSDDLNSSIVLCGGDLPLWGLLENLARIIPILIPWRFKENPITDEEKEVISKGLTRDSGELWERCSDILQNEQEERINLLKQNLGNKEIEKYEQLVAAARDELNRQMEQVGKYVDDIDHLNRQLAVLRMGNQTEEFDRLLDFMEHNKSIVSYRLLDNGIQISTVAPIDYFDRDSARSIINNDNSYLYSAVDIDIVRPILTKLFIEESYKLMVSDCFEMSLNRNGNTHTIAANYPHINRLNQSIANPHHVFYSCMGSYSVDIAESIRSGDWIGVIEACVASSKDINFMDSTVMIGFAQQIEQVYREEKDLKLVVDKEGNRYTLSEMLERG